MKDNRYVMLPPEISKAFDDLVAKSPTVGNKLMGNIQKIRPEYTADQVAATLYEGLEFIGLQQAEVFRCVAVIGDIVDLFDE
jgi:hypothetical protein